jgi:quercetin dioxygenase-like cupin family protein
MDGTNKRRRLGVGLVAIGAAMVVAIAGAQLGSATPGTGGASSILLGQGRVRNTADITAPKGTDVVVAQNTFPPSGSSGWHSHPGATVVVVQSGQITLYREAVDGGACRVRTYTAGDTFFEWKNDAQNGVNQGDTTTVVIATFFKVPASGSARIDRPDPGNCSA